MGNIEIECDLDKFKGDVFEATVENVSIVKGRNPDFPDKVHVVLECNVEFMDDLYEISIPHSTKRESVWAYWLKALKEEAGLKIAKPEDLVGVTLKFERRPVVLRGGFEARSSMPMPVELIEK